MEKDLWVQKGDVLYGSIAVRKSTSNFRDLDVKISYHYDGMPSGHIGFTNLYKVKWKECYSTSTMLLIGGCELSLERNPVNYIETVTIDDQTG